MLKNSTDLNMTQLQARRHQLSQLIATHTNAYVDYVSKGELAKARFERSEARRYMRQRDVVIKLLNESES